MRAHDIRRLTRGAPIFRITSEDLDDVEARFFDEVQAEVDEGFPVNLRPEAPEPRRTVANTRSSSPFYQLPPKVMPKVHRPALEPWPLIPQMPPTSKPPKRIEACEDCNLVHRGACW